MTSIPSTPPRMPDGTQPPFSPSPDRPLTVRQKWNNVGQIALGILVGVALSLLFLNCIISFPDRLWLFPLAAACVIVSALLAVIIQCTVRLILGGQAGYRCIYFRLLFWEWIRADDGKMMPNLSVRGAWGGMCIMQKIQERSKWRRLLYYGGGCAVVFLAAVLIELCTVFLVPRGEGAIMLHCMSVTWMFYAVACFIPGYSGYFPTDGMLFFNCISGRAAQDELDRLSLVRGMIYAGVRPRDLVVFRSEDGDYPVESDYLDEASVSGGKEPSMYELLFLWYRYLRETDAGNQDEANILLYLMRRMLPWYSADMRARIYCELCFRACLDGNAPQARFYYQKSDPCLRTDRSMMGYRVRAYYQYYVLSDVSQALESCQRGLSARKADSLMRGLEHTERDLITALEAVCLESQTMRKARSHMRLRFPSSSDKR